MLGEAFWRNAVTAALSMAIMYSIFAEMAYASQPVRRVMVGCVLNGTFINQNGYRIRVHNPQTRAAVDLSRYEGRRIRLSGNLLPGDLYYVDKAPTALGRCATPRRR